MTPIVVSIGQDYNHAHVERCEFADFAGLAEYLREHQPEGGQTGPYLCAPMLNGHRDEKSSQPASLVAIDFDDLPPEAPKVLCQAIADAGWRAALWTTRRSTPEAPRVRVVCELDRAVDKPEYAAVYRAFARHLAEMTGLDLEADPACAKPEQAAVLPQPTSTLWIRTEGAPLNVEAYLAFDPAVEDQHDDRDDGHDEDHIGEGGRNEAMSKLAFKLRKAGLDVTELEAALQEANRRRCKPPLPDDEVRTIARGKSKVEPDDDDSADVALVAFDLSELLQPIPPERDLIAGMIPTEAYTVVAGALSSAKTTFLHLTVLSRASGFDLLQLEAQIEAGPCVLVSYEDSDARIRRRLLTCIQWGHAEVKRVHGDRAADQFLASVVRNVRRITLTGQRGAALVCRDFHGNAAANMGQIDAMLTQIARFADRELLIGIDPLRLAFRGAQNDDDGADVTVETLNMLACRFHDSALVVPTHTTKAGAVEPGTDRATQAYATSGSALYSQHARSNFHLARPKPDEARKLVHPEYVTDEEISGQRVTVLSHARLSHGPERKALYYAMRKGVLVPVPSADGAETAMQALRRALPMVADAIARITTEGGRASAVMIEEDRTVRGKWARDDARKVVRQLEDQGWIATEGKTSNRRLIVTDAGRAELSRNGAARVAENGCQS